MWWPVSDNDCSLTRNFEWYFVCASLRPFPVLLASVLAWSAVLWQILQVVLVTRTRGAPYLAKTRFAASIRSGSSAFSGSISETLSCVQDLHDVVCRWSRWVLAMKLAARATSFASRAKPYCWIVSDSFILVNAFSLKCYFYLIHFALICFSTIWVRCSFLNSWFALISDLPQFF